MEVMTMDESNLLSARKKENRNMYARALTIS